MNKKKKVVMRASWKNSRNARSRVIKSMTKVIEGSLIGIAADGDLQKLSPDRKDEQKFFENGKVNAAELCSNGFCNPRERRPRQSL